MGRVTNPNTSPENPTPGATLAPDGAPTNAYDKFIEAQQKRLHGAEDIVFSQYRSTTDLIKSYPFLSGSLSGVNIARIAESQGEKTGVNLLFVHKQGTLPRDFWCGPAGCDLDVYVDDGTGYKKALGAAYKGAAVHVSRVNGQVELFIEWPQTLYFKGEREWLLQGNSFTETAYPHWHGRDCCGPALTHPVSQTSP
jgi:hypothetical protein